MSNESNERVEIHRRAGSEYRLVARLEPDQRTKVNIAVDDVLYAHLLQSDIRLSIEVHKNTPRQFQWRIRPVGIRSVGEAGWRSAIPGPASANHALACDNAAFAFDLYQKLAAKEGNLFFSPASISTCLAMTYAGARGQTAAQMAATLHFSFAPDAQHQPLAQFATRLNAPRAAPGSKLTLALANSLWPQWPQRGTEFRPEFLSLVEDQYGATVTPLDYVQAAEPARLTINRWVEDKTAGKIKGLIPAGGVDTETRLVLVNALYLLANWRLPFDARHTEDAPFTVAPGRTVQTPFMKLAAQPFKYADLGAAEALQMDYAGDALSMLVLLPRDATGLAQLERQLTLENLNRWRESLREVEVGVIFPKFRMDTSFELGATLEAMGMRDAFIPGAADFSGMNGQRDLYISEVFHKAFVVVNEERTEAAAATAAVLAQVSMVPPLRMHKPVFCADHPFIFLIQDNASGAILFAGRLAEPVVSKPLAQGV